MKCIYCEASANYKSRQPSGHCPNCRQPYAFEPKTQTYKLTDSFFLGAIDGVSYQGQLDYTNRQLWYEVNRRLWRRRMMNPIVVVVTVAFFSLFLVGVSPLFVIALPILAALVSIAWNYYVKNGPRQRPIMPLDYFTNGVLPRWIKAHGELDRLLTKEDKYIAINPRGEEADLTDYSFDRLIITENANTAAMLLANKLHLEKKCAILCAEDLSSDKAKIILKMVEHNPQLKVLVVHDATIEGCALPMKLRQESWFNEDIVELVDLGLRPNQARQLRMFTNKEPASQNLAEDARTEHLSPEEIDWLEEGNSAELEGLRPRRLLRSISYGFALADEVDQAEEKEQGDWVFDDDEGILWIESFG